MLLYFFKQMGFLKRIEELVGRKLTELVSTQRIYIKELPDI